MVNDKLVNALQAIGRLSPGRSYSKVGFVQFVRHLETYMVTICGNTQREGRPLI
jgi:hypothetical protein